MIIVVLAVLMEKPQVVPSLDEAYFREQYGGDEEILRAFDHQVTIQSCTTRIPTKDLDECRYSTVDNIHLASFGVIDLCMDSLNPHLLVVRKKSYGILYRIFSHRRMNTKFSEPENPFNEALALATLSPHPNIVRLHNYYVGDIFGRDYVRHDSVNKRIPYMACIDGSSKRSPVESKCNPEDCISDFGVLEDGQTLCIIMEHMKDGDMFKAIVADYGYMDEHTAVACFKQLLSGLAHIHKHQYALRDIALENILIQFPTSTTTAVSMDIYSDSMVHDTRHSQDDVKTENTMKVTPVSAVPKKTEIDHENKWQRLTGVPTIKFCDFGMACNVKDGEVYHECHDLRITRPHYSSPEAFHPDRLNPITRKAEKYRYDAQLSDIWSIGICFFIMITGHLPWKEPSVMDEQYRQYFSSSCPTTQTFKTRVCEPCRFKLSDQLIHMIWTCMLVPDPKSRWSAQRILDEHPLFHNVVITS